MSALLAAFLLVLPAADADDIKPLQGKWKVAAVFEDGQAMAEKDIATQMFADGTITIDGPLISFLAAGAFDPKKVAFTVDAKAEPKAIDLVGSKKTGGKGIYMVSGDSLMVCLPGTANGARPKDFGAGKGTGDVLLVFQRARANDKPETNPRPNPPKAVPHLPPAPKSEDEMRKAIVGTWGHQSDESVNYYTLNGDGTFSATLEWKKGLKQAFQDNVRSSGTWKLENGVIVATVTASTEAQMRNQIYSWRITNLGTHDLIAVDGQGRTRHEWKVR